MIKRVATGLKGFDKLIEGGLPSGSLTLVSGNPGTGKSIFCMQTAFNIAKKGSAALYISFEQTEAMMKGRNEKEVTNELKAQGLSPDFFRSPKPGEILNELSEVSEYITEKIPDYVATRNESALLMCTSTLITAGQRISDLDLLFPPKEFSMILKSNSYNYLQNLPVRVGN